MIYKATEDFKELGIDNNYQGLETEEYYALQRGEKVELKKVPERLTKGGYIVKVEKTYKPKGDNNGN